MTKNELKQLVKEVVHESYDVKQLSPLSNLLIKQNKSDIEKIIPILAKLDKIFKDITEYVHEARTTLTNPEVSDVEYDTTYSVLESIKTNLLMPLYQKGYRESELQSLIDVIENTLEGQ